MQPILVAMSFQNEPVVMTSKIPTHMRGGTKLVITSYIVFFAHRTY
jgi:hypothetical protein